MTDRNNYEYEPSPLSASGIPSSFDNSPEFYEESRTQKLWRKIKQEPLIPLGCLATCYALYQATTSIRKGDKTQTNRMFRARVYAQGFTLLALVAGSFFYKDERMRRKRFEEKVEDKKAAEKRDRWIKELEARDQEDREWRERVEKAGQAAKEAAQDVKRVKDEVKSAVEGRFSSKSVREQVCEDGWGPGMWVSRTRNAWRRI